MFPVKSRMSIFVMAHPAINQVARTMRTAALRVRPRKPVNGSGDTGGCRRAEDGFEYEVFWVLGR